MHVSRLFEYGGMCALTGLVLLSQAVSAETINTQVNVATDGTLGNSYLAYERPAVSDDGKAIAFSSEATNLDGLGDNGVDDVFVHAWDAGDNRTTTRVSVAHGGGLADDRSHQPAINADGKVIVFSSHASNLIEADENGKMDVFVHYRDTGETLLVSVPHSSEGGAEAQANGHSGAPAISADGRYVAFVSDATNLVDNPPAAVNGTKGHLYLRDLQQNTTEYIGGVVDEFFFGRFWNNMIAISDTGQYIAYFSEGAAYNSANNRVRLHDRSNGTEIAIDCPVCGTDDQYLDRPIAMSRDGGYVAFGTVHGFNGSQGLLYLYNRDTSELKEVGKGGYDGLYHYNQGSIDADISADGRYLVYTAYSDEYGDPDWPDQDALVFVEELATGFTQCVSVDANGTPWASYSWTNALSGNGDYVVFGSTSRYLVEGGDWTYDLYRHDRSNGPGCTVPMDRSDDGGTVIIIGDDSTTIVDDSETTATASGGGGGAFGLVGLLGFAMLALRRRRLVVA